MSEQATFWEHLDELRNTILRSLMSTLILSIMVFCLKDELFAIILAPRSSDFVSYRLLGIDEGFCIHLMNIGLTEQFMTHMKVALYSGLLLASPYILYEVFRFVAPGLYAGERKVAIRIVVSAYCMFILGTLIDYFLIFPLTLRFLGTYQVSSDVANMLTLQSYIDTLIGMSFMIGVVFELPVICAILGKMGLINNTMMTQYRRHAIIAILIVSAIITPTTDAFTLFVVALPIWLLYELSIWLVKITNRG
jgi:sec-independent protein translocase protein TatC